MSANDRAERLNDCLAHVKAERREILKRLFIGLASLPLLPLTASSAIAGELDGDPVNARGQGDGKKKGKGKGKGQGKKRKSH